MIVVTSCSSSVKNAKKNLKDAAVSNAWNSFIFLLKNKKNSVKASIKAAISSINQRPGYGHVLMNGVNNNPESQFSSGQIVL
jgi:hypothetical protein